MVSSSGIIFVQSLVTVGLPFRIANSGAHRQHCGLKIMICFSGIEVLLFERHVLGNFMQLNVIRLVFVWNLGGENKNAYWILVRKPD